MTAGRLTEVRPVVPPCPDPRRTDVTMSHRHTTISTYADADGARHEIAVDVDPGGRFRVLDLTGDEALVVALLRGADDDAERAMSCAADYARQITDYLAGERDDMPCPHPLGHTPVKTGAAQTDAALAA
jgi:hypothetical protein